MDVATFIERVRRHLYGASRDRYSTLASAVTDTDTVVPLSDDINMGRGSIIEVGYEQMYVQSAASGGSLTVVRGFMGTEATDHDAGALVQVDPRFSRSHLRDLLVEELDSYYPDIFSPITFEVAGTTSSRQLDLSDAFATLPAFGREPTRVLEVRGAFSDDTYSARPVVPASLRVTAAYDEDPVYRLQLEGHLRTDATVEVVVAFPILAFVDTDTVAFDSLDLLSIAGMRRQVIDVAIYGVAWRALATREVPRTEVGNQAKSRLAEEVPPEHITRTANQLKMHRDRLLAQAAAAYRDLFPLRRSGL